MIDPQDPPTWTGTWRDPRFSPPADGNNPENGLTGTLFKVNCCQFDAITVSQAQGQMRLWRNTALASLGAGQSSTIGAGTIGYEWDETPDNGFQPAGLIRLSTTTINVPSYLQDFGSNYASGTATHSLTLYRHASGALVFSAGSIRWAWGLDTHHDDDQANPGFIPPVNVSMQQATVNLLADMSAQPATLQSGLTIATASTDATAPTSTITAPLNGAVLAPGSAVTITGTASDGGGVVGGVEVSVDGGATWHPATGLASWSYAWTAAGSGAVTIRSRAVDDSGNLETPGASITVFVGRTATPSPARTPSGATIWGPTATPANAADPDTNAVELGVKFTSDVNGLITGIRFYKGATNTGTHTGTLWSSAGAPLATATFTNETAVGLAAGELRRPGGDHRQHRLRRLVSHRRRALRRRHRLLRHGRRRQSAAARAARRGERRQRRLRLRPERLPHQHVQRSNNYWVDVVVQRPGQRRRRSHRHADD